MADNYYQREMATRRQNSAAEKMLRKRVYQQGQGQPGGGINNVRKVFGPPQYNRPQRQPSFAQMLGFQQ